MKQLVVVFALFACAVTAQNLAADPLDNRLLQEALKEYRAAMDVTDRAQRVERFGRAQLLFARLVREAPEPSADLLVNLGNSALQAEQLGAAVVAYRRALLREPGHRRARTNLLFARSVLPAWIRYEASAGIVDSLFFWNQLYDAGTVRCWAALAFLGTALLLAAAIRWRQPILRSLAVLPGLVWLVLVFSLFAARLGNHNLEAVVIPDEVIARSADAVSSPPRFTNPLPGGTEVVVIEQRRDWTQVRLANSQTAWLPASSLVLVD